MAASQEGLIYSFPLSLYVAPHPEGGTVLGLDHLVYQRDRRLLLTVRVPQSISLGVALALKKKFSTEKIIDT
jgi:hypothetical protein